MKTKVNDIIFVFGNPLRKVQEMALEYDITVVGTNSPQKLMQEVKNANDVKKYFFIITNNEELEALNNFFNQLKPVQGETNFYVLVQKKLIKEVRNKENDINIRDFLDLDEDLVTEMVLETTVNGQQQYFIKKEKVPISIMTKDKMEKTGRIIDQFNRENVLEGIKKQFGQIRQNQDNLTITKALSSQMVKGEEKPTLQTQEFLIEKEEQLKAELKKAKTDNDIKEIMGTLIEVYNIRSSDIKESVTKLILQAVGESEEEGERANEKAEGVLKEIELAMLDKDKQEVEYLIGRRNEYISHINSVEEKVTDKAKMIRDVATGYLKGLKSSAQDTLKSEYAKSLPRESIMAFQETYKQNGLEVKRVSGELAEGMVHVIDGLQLVVKKYKNLATMDTSIIETQQRLVETLTTQKVVENVEYKDSLSSKVNLLISPTPNLGGSTVLRIFSKRWTQGILVLDFRETSKKIEGFEELTYEDFMKLGISDIKGMVKVSDSLAISTDEDLLLERLSDVEANFGAIFIITDQYMSTGVPPSVIQRIMYLSDSSHENLLKVNEIAQTYEFMFDLKRKMFILNKATPRAREKLNEITMIAGIDVSKVRVNVISLTTELVDNDDAEYKTISGHFNYF